MVGFLTSAPSIDLRPARANHVTNTHESPHRAAPRCFTYEVHVIAAVPSSYRHASPCLHTSRSSRRPISRPPASTKRVCVRASILQTVCVLGTPLDGAVEWGPPLGVSLAGVNAAAAELPDTIVALV